MNQFKILKLILFVIISLILINCYKHDEIYTKKYNDKIVKNVTSYKIDYSSQPSSLTSKYQGGLGSSIDLKGIKDNKVYFYMMTDRGPNIEGPLSTSNKEILLLADKSFTPYIGVVELTPGKSAKLIDGIKLTENNKNLSGIANDVLNNHLVTIDKEMNILTNSDISVDTEGLAVDKDGNFWISEEYKPSILKVDNKGNVIARYEPGNGLPSILAERTNNRGFESITVAPDGKVYAILEGILNVNNETSQFAKFIRMIELDPPSGNIKMFLYPYEQNLYKKAISVKLGDIKAIDNTHFLIIEQGPNKNSEMLNQIFLIDIENATDVLNKKLDNGKELEYATIEELESHDIRLIQKSLFLNPRNYGWDMEKMEGITIIDQNHIAITNDNDFGMKAVVNQAPSKEILDYKIDLESKKLLYNGKPIDSAKISIENTNEHSYIWIFELAKNIPYYQH